MEALMHVATRIGGTIYFNDYMHLSLYGFIFYDERNLKHYAIGFRGNIYVALRERTFFYLHPPYSLALTAEQKEMIENAWSKVRTLILRCI